MEVATTEASTSDRTEVDTSCQGDSRASCKGSVQRGVRVPKTAPMPEEGARGLRKEKVKIDSSASEATRNTDLTIPLMRLPTKGLQLNARLVERTKGGVWSSEGVSS